MTTSTTPDLRAHFSMLFATALHEVAPQLADTNIVLEKPRQAQHGDYACNLALQLAKQLRAKPRDIALKLVAALPDSPYLEKAEVAGAGFINLFLKRSYKQQVINHILQAGDGYGTSGLGQKKKVQIEFVSANPTGPLHVGHGRGAAFGASLANVLSVAGFDVSREYYVNDAGRQMDILALSTWLRYLELSGVAVPFPPNAYQGGYVRDMARQVLAAHGKRYVRDAAEIVAGAPDVATDPEAHLDALIAKAKTLLGADYGYVHGFALNEQLADCRADLTEFGVTFDGWFSEHSLYDSGMVERAVRRLAQRGHLYVQDGAKWFRSSRFGDEKDRVVQRENGQYTYFASDIAYHLNKFERGFDLVIDVWGADHHGYIARVKGALEALGLNSTQLTVALVQFAVLYRNGQKVPMSTRAGEFVTLRELRQEAGNDAARFFYVLRKSDQHLDFDLDLAKSRSNENPVYYIQYAHARVCSVHEQWGGDPASLWDVDPALLASEHELALLARLMEYPDVVEDAARELAPHLVAFYLRELAAEFHGYYNATRILVDEEPVKLARIALITAARQVLHNGLALLGVSAPERM
ncbi:MAG: arginine--tRNA ligase [Betaproteobacteria bacterium RIFCSPLOWO2_12_FULL_62_58]|nr:MAG: arginine--tRNA ligase [Betaproteobacteria bacterium RIFCSPLOWO2_02_FULL_62_79]OGA55211.1 MAG: arginine--tRNA ligase [Betaproteobacteria bacterium RIFCSPLOWO2_12_FULL_62_58]